MTDEYTLARINSLCERFEDQIQAQGLAPSIRSFLAAAADQDKGELFRHLLELELDYLIQSGKAPRSDGYLTDFPEYRDVVREVFEAALRDGSTCADRDRRSTRPGEAQVPDCRFDPGERIGGYELIETIGQGGMGSVYKARQISLNRIVALKMIQADTLQDEQLRRRFLAEAEYVATRGPLSPGTYTVKLRSAADGFRSATGSILDGDDDGIAGGDYIRTFTVAGAADNAVTLSIPNFVRGSGQAVNLPADSGGGIPITISEGQGVRRARLRIGYDPSLLVITAAAVGKEMPVGAVVALDLSTPGIAVLSFTSPVDLPVGSHELLRLQASVPGDAAANADRQQHVLDLHSVALADGAGNSIPVTADDAVHVAEYFGDTSGNRRINASDAGRIARVATLLEGGFEAAPLTDPLIVGDITGNQRLNAFDASRVAQFAVLLPVPEIPAIPSSVRAAATAKPRLRAPHAEKAPVQQIAARGIDPRGLSVIFATAGWSDAAARNGVASDQPDSAASIDPSDRGDSGAEAATAFDRLDRVMADLERSGAKQGRAAGGVGHGH